MKVEFESSFERDLKKLPADVLVELDEILDILEDSISLNDVPYSVKKLSGFPKLKAFRLKPNLNKDYRIGFYLEGDAIVLSRILKRKDIYKQFP